MHLIFKRKYFIIRNHAPNFIRIGQDSFETLIYRNLMSYEREQESTGFHKWNKYFTFFGQSSSSFSLKLHGQHIKVIFSLSQSKITSRVEVTSICLGSPCFEFEVFS